MQNQIQKQKREYIQNPFSLFSKYSFGANKRAASKMNKETANKKKNLGRKLVQKRDCVQNPRKKNKCWTKLQTFERQLLSVYSTKA